MGMNTVVILLGGNLGNVPLQFSRARHAIGQQVGRVVSQSAIYQSEPWGFEDSNLFYNAVLEVVTQLGPEEVLDKTQQIERTLGRAQKSDGRYESRPIDIDLLWMNDVVLSTARLTLPHPLMAVRRFTLEPLMEHWSAWMHPLMHKSIATLYAECPDHSKAMRMNPLHCQSDE